MNGTLIRRGRRRGTVLRIVGVLALAILAAACSSSGSSGTGSTSAATAGGSTIKVGVICDCTGPLASEIADGAKIYQAWANAVNAAGGINGHQVQVIVDDDASIPANSVTDVHNLVQSDHVIALIDLTNLDETWASYIKAQNIPVIGSNVTEDAMFDNSDFYPEGQTEDSLPVSVIDSAKSAGATNIGLLYCAEAVQCQEGIAPLKSAGKQLGLPVAYTGEVSATAPSYTAECVAAQQAHVTALFIADIAEVIANVAKDCSTQGYHPIYVIDGLSVAPSFATTPGLEDNLTGPSDDIPFYASAPEVKAMDAALDKYYPGLRENAGFTQAVSNAWPSGLLLAAAAKAGGLGANGTAPTSAELIKGLTALKGETLDGASPRLTYTPGQPHPVDCWYTFRLQGGKFSLPDGTSLTCSNS